jgi:hypothetical protein
VIDNILTLFVVETKGKFEKTHPDNSLFKDDPDATLALTQYTFEKGKTTDYKVLLVSTFSDKSDIVALMIDKPLVTDNSNSLFCTFPFGKTLMSGTKILMEVKIP